MFQSKYMKKAKANKQKNSKLALFVFFDTKLFLCITTPQYPGFYKSVFYIILIKIKGLILMIYIFFIQKKKKKEKKAHLGMHYVSSKSTKKVCMRCASLNKLCFG